MRVWRVAPLKKLQGAAGTATPGRATRREEVRKSRCCGSIPDDVRCARAAGTRRGRTRRAQCWFGVPRGLLLRASSDGGGGWHPLIPSRRCRAAGQATAPVEAPQWPPFPVEVTEARPDVQCIDGGCWVPQCRSLQCCPSAPPPPPTAPRRNAGLWCVSTRRDQHKTQKEMWLVSGLQDHRYLSVNKEAKMPVD